MPPRRRIPIEKTETKPRRRRSPTTPEGRENQLIALAHDLAEQRMRDGSASAQEVTHFLKLGSSRERLEQERLSHENKLTLARIESLESQKDMMDLYKKAIGAMRSYSGQEPLPEDDLMDELDD